MKWKTKVGGDREIITFFAWFPITIYDETKWLQKVTILRTWHTGIFWTYYENVEFINKKK